jgi:hypothetical protein
MLARQAKARLEAQETTVTVQSKTPQAEIQVPAPAHIEDRTGTGIDSEQTKYGKARDYRSPIESTYAHYETVNKRQASFDTTNFSASPSPPARRSWREV